MSRSRKKTAAYYMSSGAHPVQGKQESSRRIRRQTKIAEKLADPDNPDDIFLDDFQDAKRGKAGSRDKDYGWDYFGDGRVVLHNPERARDQEWAKKNLRKK